MTNSRLINQSPLLGGKEVLDMAPLQLSRPSLNQRTRRVARLSLKKKDESLKGERCADTTVWCSVRDRAGLHKPRNIGISPKVGLRGESVHAL